MAWDGKLQPGVFPKKSDAPNETTTWSPVSRMAPSQARKNRRVKRAATRSAHKLKEKGRTASLSVNIDETLEKAREFEGSGSFNEALLLFEKVLTLKSSDAELCEEVASVYMQAGRPDDAERMFRTAINLEPRSGFEKFAYLAQLLGNTEEALQLARCGIEIMKAEITSLDSEAEQDRIAELHGYEASAYCAVAEICLGIIEDSNDPEVAKKLDVEVERAVMTALGLSEEGSVSEMEAMISLANLRLSQGRRGDAVESMKRVLLRLSPGLEMLETGDNSDVTVAGALNLLPPLEIRIAVGKQLIEVEMWRAAIATLGSVMWECDFNVEVWYLLAVAYWKLGDFSEARGALESTRAVLRSPNGYDGELEEDMIEKLYRELDSKVADDNAMQERMQD